MRMKRTVLFMLSVVVLLFLAGCQGQNANPEGVSAVWFGGDQGLLASYELETREIYEDEAFPITVLLENKGEYTIFPHEVELEIKGISPNDFSGVDFLTDNLDQIERVSEYLPEGGYEIVDFGEALYEGLSGTFYDAEIYVEMTYPYATFVAIPRVCFKENFRDKRVCEIEGVREGYASGAPIQSGAVKQRPAGAGQFYLEIPVVNRGQGRAKAYVNDEFSNLYDEVRFEVNTEGFTCNSRGDPQIVRISRAPGSMNEQVIRCKSDRLEKGALYTQQVDITLSYYYQDLMSEVVRIKENPDLLDY
jgi:hypothetical protein